MNKALLIILLVFLIIVSGCAEQKIQQQTVAMESKIPSTAIKLTPKTDLNPVKSKSSEYYDPVPMPAPISTSGAEDSAFILPSGNTLYFFFTPDVNVPVEKQILDQVTGIYVTKKFSGEWSNPERVMLQDPGKLSGDGCEFIQGNKMWFCTVREGYTGIHWATAEMVNGQWSNWEVNDFNLDYEVGELHISKDGQILYFHSSRVGGKGGLDIWTSEKVNGEWQTPKNLENVNSQFDEGWPALSPNEKELWISKNYAIWRSKKVNGEWQEPEEMFGPLAGEATIDQSGNVYFTHHYFKNDKMLEADIYVAKKK
jgi:hypothetical protein